MGRKRKQALKLTQGAVELSKVTYTLEQIAAETGCKRSAVSTWLCGKSLPRTPQRIALKRAFGISISAWDIDARNGEYSKTPSRQQPVVPKIKPRPPEAQPETPPTDYMPARAFEDRIDVPDGTTIETCNTMYEDLEIMLQQQDITPVERAKLMSQQIQVLRLKAKIEFDSIRIKDLVLREHPDWVLLKQGMLSCFVDCEGCRTRVQAYLQGPGARL